MCGICSSKTLHFQVVQVVLHVVVFLSVRILILNRDNNSIFVAVSVSYSARESRPHCFGMIVTPTVKVSLLKGKFFAQKIPAIR